MIFATFKESISNINYIDLAVALVIIIAVGIINYKQTKKLALLIIYLVIYALLCVFSIFDFEICYSITLVALFVLTSANITILLQDINSFFKRKKKVNNRKVNQSVEYLVNVLNDTVMILSETKTGAIITLEHNEDLDEFIEKGDAVNAPVSSELLRTIFYEGTPLHDGAVIIKDNMIKAASVYYTPTTKALPGKYGARHRAALGFSEVHPSITIVVSEETGRISFAVAGELVNTTRDTFKRKLADYIE